MTAITLRKRTVSMTLALVLAGVATVSLVSWLRGVEREAYAGVETVEVFVAKGDIPAGTTVEEMTAKGLVQRVTVPRTLITTDAVTSLTQIEGKVAVTSIVEGEHLLVRRFGATAEASALLPIPPGMHAMTISATTPTAVGGFVQPNDKVSLIAKMDIQVSEKGSSSADPFGLGSLFGGSKVTIARYIVKNALVLAVDRAIAGRRSREEASDKKTSSRDVTFTLAVKPQDAEKIALAVLTGKIYFTLARPDAKGFKTTGSTPLSLFR